MNAVFRWVELCSHECLQRLCNAEGKSTRLGRLRAAGKRRFGGDLAAFLNRLNRAELDQLAAEERLERAPTVGAAREALWRRGAALEASGSHEHIGTRLQPAPVLLRGKLLHLAERPGITPPAADWPRPIPAPRPAPTPPGPPSSLEELLDAACALLGVRLGRAQRDKGAYGVRVAALLGLIDDGHSEPDWRGEVEIKTVPVVRDRSGLWWVKEDPAISMKDGSPLSKLSRVLWVARVADDDDSPILSWFFQEWDEELARLVARYLHTRPKGGAGATTRGWYLHKRFFVESGLLRSLNG